MMQNLLEGFLQRAEFFRKYTMARHCVVGTEPNFEMKGVWLWRGKEKSQYLLSEHPQIEYYKMRQLTPSNPEDRKLVEMYWCGKEGDDLAGVTLRDSKWMR